MKEMKLTVVTPDGQYGPTVCDSVHVTIRDDSRGNGGGSYGIRAGTAPSLLALDDGPLSAYRDGVLLLQAHCEGGFATVEHGAVTVVTERYIKKENKHGEI